LFGIWMLLKKHWGAIAGMGGTVLGWMVLSFAAKRNWMGDWLSSGTGKLDSNAALMPTLRGASAQLFGLRSGWQLFAVFLSILLLAFGVFIAWKSKSENEMHPLAWFLIPISLLTIPYIWNYEPASAHYLGDFHCGSSGSERSSFSRKRIVILNLGYLLRWFHSSWPFPWIMMY
jgi:hypothetical protein